MGDWLGDLSAEVRLAVIDPRIWIGAVEAAILFVVATLLGRFIGRRTGLLGSDAPRSEVMAVGLALGLSVLVAVWALVVSGGSSAFTPVATSYLVCIGLALARPAGADPSRPKSRVASRGAEQSNVRRWLVISVGSIIFIVITAILYGSTMVLMQRDGVQPVEFFDEAFYSVLARDLGQTGVESLFSPSGFASLPGTPDQTWYHWGELWLASAAIRLFGAAPIDARHFVVMPVLLLAVAMLTGTLVRVLARTSARSAYILGTLACLFLAPIPTLDGPIHASWAVGMVFGITLYGSAAVATALGLYSAIVLTERRPSWALAGVVATGLVFLLPAHLIVAILAMVGAVAAIVWLAVTQKLDGRTLSVPLIWQRTAIWVVVLTALTGAWGLQTGHGIGASSPSAGVRPFDPAWQTAILSAMLGSLAMLAVPLGAVLLRREAPILAAACAGAIAVVVAGAAAWGLRFADFNMFHVFFAGVAVCLTPVAAAAIWALWHRSRASGHRVVAAMIVAILFIQIGIGTVTSVFRLQRFGPGNYDPIPVAVLDAIRNLPTDAKIAYECQPFEEHSVWDPRLESIDAHTGRRAITMCFHADAVGPMIGGPVDPTAEAPFFRFAPQRVLYPESSTIPTSEAVAGFLAANGIRYVYTDPFHVGRVLPAGVEIIRVGPFRLARVP